MPICCEGMQEECHIQSMCGDKPVMQGSHWKNCNKDGETMPYNAADTEAESRCTADGGIPDENPYSCQDVMDNAYLDTSSRCDSMNYWMPICCGGGHARPGCIA